MESSIYDSNYTMQIIGRMPFGFEVAKVDLQNVLKAHKANKSNLAFELAIDSFLLGFIYGKKAERAKKHHKAIKPICKWGGVENEPIPQTNHFELLELMNTANTLNKKNLNLLISISKQLGE